MAYVDVPFRTDALCPFPSDFFHVLHREPDGRLYVGGWTASHLVEVTKALCAADNVTPKKDPFWVAEYLHRKGKVINIYSRAWGEQAFIDDAYAYGPATYDLARQYVKTNMVQSFLNMNRATYASRADLQHEFPNHSVWPWLHKHTLDEACFAILTEWNKGLDQNYDALGLAENQRVYISYISLFEDMKECLLKFAEQAMKEGRILSTRQKFALQGCDAERFLGYRYRADVIEQYLADRESHNRPAIHR